MNLVDTCSQLNTHPIPTPYTRQFCMMEMLLGEDFTQLLDSFPDIMEHVMHVAAQKSKRNGLKNWQMSQDDSSGDSRKQEKVQAIGGKWNVKNTTGWKQSPAGGRDQEERDEETENMTGRARRGRDLFAGGSGGGGSGGAGGVDGGSSGASNSHGAFTNGGGGEKMSPGGASGKVGGEPKKVGSVLGKGKSWTSKRIKQKDSPSTKQYEAMNQAAMSEHSVSGDAAAKM
jgi:hypothetical protein